MTSFLVLYGTGEGQTAKVADRIVAALEARGHDATAVDAAAPPADVAVDDFDAVVVGTSIHGDRPQESVREFVDANRDALAARPSAYFQVCLSVALPDEESQAKAARYVDEFVEDTDWHPDRIAVFGGALRYSEYGFLMRQMIKQVAKRTTGDTDTSRNYEYTDWDEVDQFAADVAAFVETELGAETPAPDEQTAESPAPDDRTEVE